MRGVFSPSLSYHALSLTGKKPRALRSLSTDAPLILKAAMRGVFIGVGARPFRIVARSVPISVPRSAKRSRMPANEDPRIYFAAERTLLAWLRTGIAVIGLGFLVARFGLFLTLIRNPHAVPAAVTGSTLIGTGFVILGAFVIAIAAWQHFRFSRMLGHDQQPSQYWTSFSLWVAAIMAALGAALAGYLLASLVSTSHSLAQ